MLHLMTDILIVKITQFSLDLFISFGPVPHSSLPLSLSELAVSMATVTRHEDIEDTAGDVLRLITSLP